MAEYTSTMLQTVQPNQPVVLTETPVPGKSCIQHREGAGIVTLRGITSQCRALYKVTFGGNVAVPVNGTAGAISVAVAIDGESLPSATSTVTPATTGAFFNVFSSAFVPVPSGCCVTVSVRNVSAQPIEVINANLIVERVC